MPINLPKHRRGFIQDHLFTLGYSVSFEDNIPVARYIDTGQMVSTADETTINAIIAAYDQLPEAKAETRARIKLEAAKRTNVLYPFIDPLAEEAIGFYDFASDIYLSIKSGSRNPLSGSLLELQNIRNAAVAAISDVNAMTDLNLILDYDVVNTPTWPV